MNTLANSSVYPILAEVTHSDGLVANLLQALLVGICVAAIWATGRWFIGKFKLPEIAMTIWNGAFVLVGLIVLINFVMSLGGHGFIRLW